MSVMRLYTLYKKPTDSNQMEIWPFFNKANMHTQIKHANVFTEQITVSKNKPGQCKTLHRVFHSIWIRVGDEQHSTCNWVVNLYLRTISSCVDIMEMSVGEMEMRQHLWHLSNQTKSCVTSGQKLCKTYCRTDETSLHLCLSFPLL